MLSSPNDGYVPSWSFLYACTNCPDFPIFDTSSDELKVTVEFDPEMSGEFDRRISSGFNTALLDSINLTVTNNSRYPVQYAWFIRQSGAFFRPYPNPSVTDIPNGKVYEGDPSFVFVSDEWCYLPKHNGTNRRDICLTFCPSSWHYVGSSSSSSVNVKFSQMKLDVGVVYEVLVYAIRNDKDNVCVIPYNQFSAMNYDCDYALDFTDCELVYQKLFSPVNPAEFVSGRTDNGVYSFDPSDVGLFNRATGYIDDDGKVVIGNIDTNNIANRPDSWGSDYYTDAWTGSVSKASVTDSLTSLSGSVSSYLKFVNTVFGYFPKNVQVAFSLGLMGLVVLSIFKVVIR